MILPCASTGFSGMEIVFRYDTDTLAVVECERTGVSPITVRAMAKRDDGSAEWYADFSAPGWAAVGGVSFASAELDGITFQFQVVD